MADQVVLDHNDNDIDEELEELEEQTKTKIIFKHGLAKNNEDISQEDLISLYHSFDISSDQMNKRFSSWRLDVIHIRGVQDMSSDDVLNYFDSFEPKSIEWVNDLSCNVVFADPMSAAIAIKSLTTALVLKSSASKTTQGLAFAVIEAESLSVPIPPPFRWALGLTHPKAKALLLRFATISDKKSLNSKPNNAIVANIQSNSYNSEQFEMRAKRFRMRADEEEKQKMLIRDRIASPNNTARSDKSIWDRLDHRLDRRLGTRLGVPSLANFRPPDSHLIQVSVDNTSDCRSASSETPLRSTISVVGRPESAVQRANTDLRYRIKRKFQ